MSCVETPFLSFEQDNHCSSLLLLLLMITLRKFTNLNIIKNFFKCQENFSLWTLCKRYEMYFQNETFTEVYLSGYQLRAQFTFEY